MALTNLQVQRAVPKEKAYKLADAKGLYLYVTVKGQRYWRMDYRVAGKRKTLAPGVYPEVKLVDARSKRDDARKLLQDNLDPTQEKRIKKLATKQAHANSFKAIAIEWYEKEKAH